MVGWHPPYRSLKEGELTSIAWEGVSNLDIERIFWSQLDPFYHLKQANCIRYTKNVGDHYLLDGEPLINHEIGRDMVEGFESMQRSALRFIRFHAIETFLTALCGSPPHGPVPRFCAVYKFDEFNRIISKLAKKSIPDELGIGEVSDFSEWVSAKFTSRKITGQTETLPTDVIDFISLQARILSEKSVYNAFKHGCRVGHGIPDLQIQDKETGEWESLVPIKDGVAWLEWKENRRTGKFSIEFGAMECDIEDDHSAIFIMSILVRTMKTIRLAQKGEKIDVQMLTKIKKGKIPQYFNLKITPEP